MDKIKTNLQILLYIILMIILIVPIVLIAIYLVKNNKTISLTPKFEVKDILIENKKEINPTVLGESVNIANEILTKIKKDKTNEI